MMSNATEQTMQCMEVWGGNRYTNRNIEIAGLKTEIYCKPFNDEEAGGDVYYISSCATGRITRLLVADVSGHGKAVADLAHQLRMLMRKYVNFINQSRFVKELNEQFGAVTNSGRFATAVVMTYFAPTNEIILTNAGHPPPLLYCSKTKKWDFIDKNIIQSQVTDIPLGILSDRDYHQCRIYLQPGDFVVCYTDSLIELSQKDNTQLGEEGLLNVINEHTQIGDTPFIPQLLDALQQKTTANFKDDITILAIQPMITGQRISIRDKVKAPFRILLKILHSLFAKEPLPRLEWSLQNLGGALIHRFNFSKKKRNES